MQTEDPEMGKNYDILRACLSIQPDTSASCYDCSENVEGIYNYSLRRKVYVNQSLEETKRVENFGEQLPILTDMYAYPENTNGETEELTSYSSNTGDIENPGISMEFSVFLPQNNQAKDFIFAQNILSGDGLKDIKISKDSYDQQQNKRLHNFDGTFIPKNSNSSSVESQDGYGVVERTFRSTMTQLEGNT
ncbi:uncharacterized protein LOC134257919 [Saccostrea cucullata]|uniref:uncharacterized protein LOC134257919 n=1 Tax=Saccostrea cuccullata TaxID=36930 RepID=UPI002ED28E4E